MIKRQTSISRNIVQFCRFLRLKGFAVSVEDEATALNALLFIDYSNRDVFALGLKCVCCKSRAQQNKFDALFNEYWKEIETAIDSKIKTTAQPVLKTVSKEPSFKSLKTWLNGNQNEEVEQTSFYSIHENLSQKDFSSVPADELDELMRIIRALSVRLAAHINRRYRKSPKDDLPDLRRTLRKNMRFGGELLEIACRKPRPNRTKLAIICDVSKSMDLYAAFLLQFMFAFQQVYRRMETFTFSTSLQCITTLLKQHDFKNAIELLGRKNNSWSGGTRIGESLHQFVNDYESRILDKRTIIIILSDGWDTGNIALLEQSMETIKARSKKVIWLNPVAGYHSYQPDTAGMRAAMPFVDVFTSVHNAESLRKLAKWL